jgi:membrane fusion protein, multidrug efflux system
MAAIALLIALWVWYQQWRYIEKTDNAYLQADAVVIAPRIAGNIIELAVSDNQVVAREQTLVRIDPSTYRAVLDAAAAEVAQRKAELARIDVDIRRQREIQTEADAQVNVTEAAARIAEVEAGRFERLAKTGADTIQHRDEANTTREQTRNQLIAVRAASRSAVLQAELLQAQVTQGRAALQAAEARLRAAQTDMDATTIRSPIDGIVGDRTVRVGQFAQPGTRLLTVVPGGETYLVANFKETQLRYMRVGQHAEVEIDALPGPPIKAVVESLAPGTGAEFALLPPDNATGNFTRIVQRVPVRIALELDEKTRALLRPGLSATVHIDTRNVERQ